MSIANLPARYRTSTYSAERASAVVCRLSSGRSLAAVCRDADLPCLNTVHNWMRKHPDFAAQVAAVRDRAGGRRSPGGHNGLRYRAALAQGICAALAEGFTLKQVCAHPSVPVSPNCVQAWARERPDFAALYRAACAPRRTRDGLRIGRGRRGARTRALTDQLVARLIDGRPLADIARDPDMPTASVIRHWRAQSTDFHFEIQAARRFQLDILLDAFIDPIGRPPAATRSTITALVRHGYGR